MCFSIPTRALVDSYKGLKIWVMLEHTVGRMDSQREDNL